MTKKPNCSTCRCEFDDCKSKVYGLACLEHPNAREYLMAPVEKYVVPAGNYAYIAHGKKPSIKVDGAATILVIK